VRNGVVSKNSFLSFTQNLIVAISLLASFCSEFSIETVVSEPHNPLAMQLIRDIIKAKLASRKPVVSYEFFPPKTPEGDETLLSKTLPELMRCNPDFCSVTYGAGGGTRAKTLAIVDRIQREHKLPAVCHLTCVGSTATEMGKVLDEARALNISNILALRGDPPGGVGEYPITPGGFEHAYQLVRFIREQGPFCVGAAGFPEGHIACKEGRETDWDRLKLKVDSGAEFVLTQLFFNNADYFRMRDYANSKGITVPIFPGIIHFLSLSQVQRFTTLCGAKVPSAVVEKLEKLKDDDAACVEFGIEYSAKQCAELLREGAPGLHFFTLNKAYSTSQVLKALSL